MDEITLAVLANPTDKELSLLEGLPENATFAVGDNPEAFERVVGDATVILNWYHGGALLQKVYGLCPKLKWVHSRSAGLDALLFPELVESPVVLTNGGGVFSPPLGEFAVAGILHFAKSLRRLVRSQEAGLWDVFDTVEIAGQTVGIVGYGDIGRAVASRVRPLGMRVTAVRRSGADPAKADPYADKVYGPEGLLDMLRESDYVVACAPLTPQTRGLLGEAAFAAMKPSAVVINLGRGPVIDEAAMVRALTDRRIKGAALDVFDQEPLPAGHPLYGLDNVLLSPHTADHTPDWLERGMRFFLENFARFAGGEPLKNVVDKQRGY